MWYPRDLLGWFSHVSKGVNPQSFPFSSLPGSVYKKEHTSIKWNAFWFVVLVFFLKYNTVSTNYLDTEKKTWRTGVFLSHNLKSIFHGNSSLRGVFWSFFKISKNNQVELLYQNSNFTAISRSHGSRFWKASFLVTLNEIQSVLLSAANKMQLKKFTRQNSNFQFFFRFGQWVNRLSFFNS